MTPTDREEAQTMAISFILLVFALVFIVAGVMR